MTLAEFVQEQHNKMDQFQREWLKKNTEEGDDNYPLDMDEVEWDEQFLAWLGIEEL